MSHAAKSLPAATKKEKDSFIFLSLEGDIPSQRARHTTQESLSDPESKEKQKTQKSHVSGSPAELFNMTLSQRKGEEKCLTLSPLSDAVAGLTYSPFYTFLHFPDILQ